MIPSSLVSDFLGKNKSFNLFTALFKILFPKRFPPKYFFFNSFIYRIDIFSSISADGLKKNRQEIFAKIDSISTRTCQQQIWNEKRRTLCSRLHPELSTVACRVQCAFVGS